MKVIHPYQHTQDEASDTWDINHNLGLHPLVDVMVDVAGVMTKIIPKDIKIIDLNNVQVLFSQPFSGSARVV